MSNERHFDSCQVMEFRSNYVSAKIIIIECCYQVRETGAAIFQRETGNGCCVAYYVTLEDMF